MSGGLEMSALTIRLPDDTAQRLKSLAKSRGLPMNKLVEQLSAHALAAWDTENHFFAMAATGDVSQALAALDRLDAADAASFQRQSCVGPASLRSSKQLSRSVNWNLTPISPPTFHAVVSSSPRLRQSP
jgi:predicted DNA-binding protein